MPETRFARETRRLAPLVTCEHGGHQVPAAYAELFRGREELLAGHRGWDPGTLELGRELARRLGAPLVATTTSRLVVEVNRSLSHPRLFSEFTRALGAAERSELLERYYHPHRRRVEEEAARILRRGEVVLHLGVHSFTPIWRGEERRVDVALLYDPARVAERTAAGAILSDLRAARPDLRGRRNNPYLGKADGLTTSLRRRFDPSDYLGLEIEVNQRFPLGDAAPWKGLRRALGDAVQRLISERSSSEPS